MRQSLRLISLSNYVFVLEISQISGIAQNVSMLIMAVMRIVAVVGGGKERERRSVAGTHSPPWSRSFTSNARISQRQFAWKMSLPDPPPSPPPSLPEQGCSYLSCTTKGSPLSLPPHASAANVPQHRVLHVRRLRFCFSQASCQSIGDRPPNPNPNLLRRTLKPISYTIFPTSKNKITSFYMEGKTRHHNEAPV